MKVGKFTGRSLPKASPSGSTQVEWRPLSLAQLKDIVPSGATVHAYADLTGGFLTKPGRAYLRIDYSASRIGAIVVTNGPITENQISFWDGNGTVTLNVKRSAPGKVYIADCGVLGGSGSTNFTITSYDGHTETWNNPYSYPGELSEIHLVFSIVPADNEWYGVSITNGKGWVFQGCRVMEY